MLETVISYSLQQLLDPFPSAKIILDFTAVPRLAPTTAALASWRQQLFSYLSEMAYNNKAPDPDKNIVDFHFPAAENTVSLKFYLIPDQNARDIFCQATVIKSVETDHPPSIASGRNTFLALVGL